MSASTADIENGKEENAENIDNIEIDEKKKE